MQTSIKEMIESQVKFADFEKIATYKYQEFKSFMDFNKKSIVLEGFKVKTSNPRYKLFYNTGFCVWCTETIGEVVLIARKGAKPGSQAHLTFWNWFDDKKDKPIQFFTKDHIMPRKRGGPDAMWNYQSMCKSCNNKKGHGVPDTRRFELRKLPYTVHQKQTELWLRKRFGA